MSKWTLKKIRDHHLGKVAYYTDEKNRRAMQRHQQMADALSERIAADEAAVPVAFVRRHESGQIGALGFTKLGDSNGWTDATLFTHPPAQPAQMGEFKPDWVGYRQGMKDGRFDLIEGAARGQSLGMVVYHDDEAKAAALEGRRVLIMADDSIEAMSGRKSPIDLAAIREVIAKLHSCNCSGNDCNGLSDKLSRAIGDTP